MAKYIIYLDGSELLCEDHYGRDYFAGSAMTGWKCEYCKGDHIHGNTATPRICMGCAFARKECQRCEKKLPDWAITS